jgi:hypothetical protein
VLTNQDVLENRETPEKLNILERPGHSHGDQFMDFFAMHVPALIDNTSRIRNVRTGDGVEKSCFSGAVGTDDGMNDALFDLERHLEKRLQTTESLADFLNL